MIWIIGGNSDARILTSLIKEPYLLTTATKDGEKFYWNQGGFEKKMNYIQMVKFIEDEKIKLCIDASHPFAKVVSKEAEKACQKCKINYVRFEREREIVEGENIINVFSYDEASNYLKTFKGTAFFTTGSNRVLDFEKIRRENRFIYRILITSTSIKKLEEIGVSIKDMVGILGPVSKDLNKAFLQNYKADILVTKNSGLSGGFYEKIEACKEIGIKILVINDLNENENLSIEDFYKEKILPLIK